MSLAVLAALVLNGPLQTPSDKRIFMPQLAARPGGEKRLNLYWADEPMARTKLSPKRFPPTNEPYTFDYFVGGYVKLDPKSSPQTTVRFRVYNQLKPKPDDESHQATRLLLRLWETLDSWGADHSPDYAGSVVDVYLCWGGTPGGEALFDHDPQVPPGVNGKVATMYIYDLPSFRNPVERAREIAHEYGHLVLPAIGGYSAPEDWANGVMGERLFLTQLAAERTTGIVPAEDAFGLSAAGLQAWVAANVVPYRDRAALEGPFGPRYARRDKDGMDAFVGEASLLQALLAPRKFGRALSLMESQRAPALVKSAALAVDEGGATLAIPASLVGKPIWVPVGRNRITGAKRVLAKRAGWAKLVPAGATVTLKL